MPKEVGSNKRDGILKPPPIKEITLQNMIRYSRVVLSSLLEEGVISKDQMEEIDWGSLLSRVKEEFKKNGLDGIKSPQSFATKGSARDAFRDALQRGQSQSPIIGKDGVFPKFFALLMQQVFGSRQMIDSLLKGLDSLKKKNVNSVTLLQLKEQRSDLREIATLLIERNIISIRSIRAYLKLILRVTLTGEELKKYEDIITGLTITAGAISKKSKKLVRNSINSPRWTPPAGFKCGKLPKVDYATSAGEADGRQAIGEDKGGDLGLTTAEELEQVARGTDIRQPKAEDNLPTPKIKHRRDLGKHTG